LDKGLQACGGWTQFSRWLALYNYAIMGFGGAGGAIRGARSDCLKMDQPMASNF